MQRRCSRRWALARSRRATPASDGLLEQLLSRRIIFVAGKGGTGKTTVSAALCLLGARAGKNVLGVEVDAKGDLSVALGSEGARSKPEAVQPNISVMALRAEESFQEYLNLYFKVPRLARVTPLARVFDFIATAVPGPRDMLVVGKIAFEERRRDQDGQVWDLIVVDSSASGHIVSQLNAARSMLQLVHGGMIRTQLEWIDSVLSDKGLTTAVLTALPEEMPVVETLELHNGLTRARNLNVAACFLNRVVPDPLTAPERRLLTALLAAGEEVDQRLGGGLSTVAEDLRLAERLHRAGEVQERRLRAHLPVPVVEIPLASARAGLATTRAVATAIRRGAN